MKQTAEYQKIELLGIEAIPYVLQNIQKSDKDEIAKFFVIYSVNEMLGFHVMVGSWESGYRVNCTYKMYTAEWYAFQLQSFLSQETIEIKDMQKKTGLDIYADYNDVNLKNKVKNTLDEISIKDNPILSGPPSIEDNRKSYEIIKTLGEDAIPYLLSYTTDKEMRKLNPSCRAKQWFVTRCAYDMYYEVHEEIASEYKKRLDIYYISICNIDKF